jgi:transposase
MDWAQVRALAADGVSQREIARRLGIGRNTVRRLVEASEPPRYSRAPAGSMLDSLEGVIRRLVDEWPDIKAPRVAEILRDDHGYPGSVDLVRRRLARLRPRQVRPAQRTGYRPGQVLQLDWAEMPTRPRIAGRERRVYALVATLPYRAETADRREARRSAGATNNSPRLRARPDTSRGVRTRHVVRRTVRNVIE